jgi:hypothetical protein
MGAYGRISEDVEWNEVSNGLITAYFLFCEVVWIRGVEAVRSNLGRVQPKTNVVYTCIF